MHAGVAGSADAEIGPVAYVSKARLGKTINDRHSVIGRTVVDDDDLRLSMLPQRGRDRPFDQVGTIERGNHDAHECQRIA